MRLIIALAGLMMALPALGDTHETVERGRELFGRENYAEAYELFHEAAADFPEEPLLDFNMAATFYKRADYDAAIERYEKALAAKDLFLEAAAKYNLGNCWFRQAVKNQSELPTAIDQLDRSMRYYRDAMDDLPDTTAARRNIEKAKLLKKMLLDEMKKREEEKQKQQQNKQNDEQKEQKDEQEQDGQDEKQEEAPQPGEQQQKEMTPEEAAQVLNAIRENQQREEREQRRTIRGQYLPVDKDW